MIQEERFNEEEQQLVRDIRGANIILSSLIRQIKDKDASCVSLMYLETSIMWAIKGICIGESK